MAKPKRQSALFAVSDSLDTYSTFEKMSHTSHPPMPVASFRQSVRSSRKTPGSQRVGKKFSLTSGGIHRRRNKRSF
jgi:hypothetical protein